VTRALAVTALLICLAIGGCGGDDSGETTAPPTVSIPPITSPIPATTTTAPATTTTPTGSTTTGTSGNGRSGKSFDPSQPDSQTNDVPPPAGSPQEAFEKHCEQNPQACG
jgi:hypothetical protein